MTAPTPRAAARAPSQQERKRTQSAEFARDHAHYRSLPAEQWRAHFRATSPAARETFASTIGQDGVIVSCGSRAVLLK